MSLLGICRNILHSAGRNFHEEMEGVTIWLHGTGGAPRDKFVRVDYDANGHKSPVAFQEALAILSDFAPTLIAPSHTLRVVHDFEDASISLRLEPSDPGAAQKIRPEI